MTDIQWRDTAPLIPYLKDPAILCRVRWAKTLGSTNDVLKADPSLPHGAIVAADAQGAGRGRMGRAFFSPKDSGLYLSVRYRPADNPALTDFVTMGACAVTVQGIETASGTAPKIKWVNDLMIGPRKIAGILTESRADPDPEKQWLVVGIGINLFEPEGGFPDEIAERAGSVTGTTARAFAETGGDPDELRTRLLAAMVDGLTALGQAKSPAPYAELYRSHSNLIGRAVTLTGAGAPIIGTVTGFDDFGHLKLQLPDGTSRLICSGELTLRPL